MQRGACKDKMLLSFEMTHAHARRMVKMIIPSEKDGALLPGGGARARWQRWWQGGRRRWRSLLLPWDACHAMPITTASLPPAFASRRFLLLFSCLEKLSPSFLLPSVFVICLFSLFAAVIRLFFPTPSTPVLPPTPPQVAGTPTLPTYPPPVSSVPTTSQTRRVWWVGWW